MSTDDIRAQAELILVEQTRRYNPDLGVPFRAWLAMQLRLRLWNAVGYARPGPGSKHGRKRIQTEPVDPEIADSEILHEELAHLTADPDARVIIGMVVSGHRLSRKAAAEYGLPADRYDATLARLRARLR